MRLLPPELGVEGGIPVAVHPAFGHQRPQVGQHREAGGRVQAGIHGGVHDPDDVGDGAVPGGQRGQDLGLSLGPVRRQGGEVGAGFGDAWMSRRVRR